MKWISFGSATKVLHLIGLLSFCSLQAQSQTAVQAINTALYPLDTSSYSTKDFLPEYIFSNTAIIALGESTHGTKEFNIIKDYIIRNQILYNDVKIVAMEVEFCGLLGLNEYLLDNTKSLDSVFSELDKSGMPGIYFTKEVLEMLRWIKQYNLAKANEKDKVRLFGLDMQDPYSITKAIMDRFPQLKSFSIEDYNKLLELNRLYYPRKEVKMSREMKDSYKKLADNISLLVHRKAPTTDTLFLLHFAELLKQTIALRDGIIFSKVTKNYREQRDAYMAANVIWMQGSFNSENSKMIVWAHNGHIAHAKLNGTHRMGYHLQAYFKEKYYAVDFVFDEGSVRMYDPKETKRYRPFFYPSSTNENSVEYMLKGSNSPLFFLNVNSSTNPSVRTFFSNNKYQRMIGALYQNNSIKDYEEMPVLECFDGLIFIKKAKAAESIR